MKTRKFLAFMLSLVMVLSLCGGAFAAPHLTDEVTELETKNSDISESLAEEGYVLLENNGVLPLDKGGKEIALYGNAIAYTVKGGTGSGAVNNRANDNIAEAFEAAGWTVANPNYVLDVRAQKDNEGNIRYNEDGTPVYRTGVTSDVEITDEALAEGKSTDTAIFAIARNAGEGSDRTLGQYGLVTQVQRDPETNEIIADAYTSYTENLSTNAYSLTDIERANIEKVAAAYENVIVVLNTPVIDTKWLHEVPNIDGVIYMHNGGQRGSEALVNIITGKATPSGKLTDTFALNYEDYPEAAQSFSYLDGNENNEWYTDGIYVGYRYFDTFGKEVSYPFGYGLSYTDFDITVDEVAVDADYVTVTATVANVGDKYAGKEVVEVYFSAPQGKLDKPYQELAAYGKTDLLQPGQQQTLTVNFATKDLSSYSEELAAYVIEAGEYIIRVGNGSRSTHVAAVLTASEDMITEQLANKLQLEENAVLDEIDSFDATPITYEGEADEIANAERIAIPAIEAAPLPEYNDGNAHVYLFADDAENFVARTGITLRSKASARPYTLNNAEYPNGDGPSNGYGPTYNGYSEYVYDEVVEIVPDLPDGITKETAKLTDVYEGKITMDQFLACLSSDECARLAVGGAGTMEPAYAEDGNEIGGSSTYAQGGAGQTTQAYYLTRHIPVLPNADGPAGVRITQHYWLDVDTGARYTSIYYNDEGQTCTRKGNNRTGYTYTPVNVIDQYQFCTAFPAGNCMAMTWDVDLIYAEGVAVGSEMYEYGVTTWLAPGINIHRNPLCGRNFEYYSEDPLVTGLTAAHVTAGVQSNPGVGVTIKHFYGNSQEFRRSYCNNIISERASREIYLKGFEICVRLAQPQCIMNSYNANNGWFSSDNRELNEDITRDEWGFKGAIMTDWGGGQSDPPISMYAGCDLIMSGGDSRMNQVRNAVGAPKEPTFNEDGSIANQGDFVFDPDQSEPPTYTIETNLESVDAAPESVKRAEQAGYASIFLRGGKVVVGWYGSLNEIGKISYGDVQKSARRMLNLCLQSKDMVALYADLLDKTVDDPVPYSEANDAPLATGYDVVVKGEVTDIPGIKAGTVEVDTAESLTVDVPFTYDGDVELTTARFTITSDVPFATETVDGELVGVFTSDNDVEFNPATKEIIVYKGDGEAISGDLFTLTFDASDVEESGEYPVVIELIEATDANGDLITVNTFDGCIKVTVAPKIGDVNQDGQVDNRDLIMIARYLVHLVDFTEDQKALADINGDEIVNNTDLVLLARILVGADQ